MQWLEKAFNHFLQLDPETKIRLAALEDCVVTIEFLPLHYSFQIFFSQAKAEFIYDNFLPPTLTIKGTPLRLLQLSLTDAKKRNTFFADDVIVEGDMERAKDVIALFDEFNIDWEEQVSTWLGDFPAYQTGRLVRKAKQISERVRKSVLRNLNEYLHEEANYVPPLAALEEFYQEVDEFRLTVDRLEQRVQSLIKLAESK